LLKILRRYEFNAANLQLKIFFWGTQSVSFLVRLHSFGPTDLERIE
jgi:hypothetical protein